MNTEKLIKDTKVKFAACLIIGLIILITGVVLKISNVNFIQNLKGIIGLSIIPLSGALGYLIQLNFYKKFPQKIRNIIINKSDERVVSINNEVDAKTFRIFQVALFITYMGYTLIIPKDVFESIGWWIVLGLLFLSFLIKVIINRVVTKANVIKNEEA